MEQELNIQDKGGKIVVVLHALISVLKLYDTNNAAVVRQIDSLEKELNSLFEKGLQELRITLRSDEFFVNDRLLKVDIQLYLRAKELAESLAPFEWSDIRFSAGITRQDINDFVSGLSNSVRQGKKMFSQEGYGGIVGSVAKGSSASAFRFEPDKLAIWLYAGLLEVVDVLYEKFDDGETPSLLPVRRSLQMIIDNMKEYNGIYQMLSAFRTPSLPRTKANTRVAMAIDIIGFGNFVQIPNVTVMNLALACVLGGLATTENPTESVRPLFRFGGLGETAIGLIVALYDARANRQGKKVSFQGRLLMAVEEYHNLLNREPTSPLPALIFKMTDSKHMIDRNIANLFARYKGPFPIGSILKVDGKTVIVTGHGATETGKQRPIVMGLYNGKLRNSIDLSNEPSKKIETLSSLSKEGIVIQELQ